MKDSKPKRSKGSESGLWQILVFLTSISASIMFWWTLIWMMQVPALLWGLLFMTFSFLPIVLITGLLGFGIFLLLTVKLLRERF